jgi:hypothetical protein
MFGRMMIEPLCRSTPQSSADSGSHADKGQRKRRDRALDRAAGVDTAVLACARRCGFRGKSYVLDRKKGTWYAVDFEDL